MVSKVVNNQNNKLTRGEELVVMMVKRCSRGDGVLGDEKDEGD